MRIYKCPMRIYKYPMGFRTPAVDQPYSSIYYNHDLILDIWHDLGSINNEVVYEGGCRKAHTQADTILSSQQQQSVKEKTL